MSAVHRYLSGGVLALLATSVAGAATLNYEQVNRNISNALSEVLAGQEDVRSFELRFDPAGTDPDQDRYQVEAAAEVAAFAGLKEDLKITATKLISKQKDGNLAVAAQINFHGDGVALMRKLIAFDEKLACGLKEKAYGFQKLLLEEDCRVTKKLRKVQSIEEISVVMKEHLARHKADIRVYIAATDRAIAALAKSAVRDELVGDRKKAEEVLNVLNRVKFEDGKAYFSFSAEAMDLGIISLLNGVEDLAAVERVGMSVTAEALSVNFTLTSKVLDAVYPHVKPEVVRLLEGLAVGDEHAKLTLQSQIRVVLSVIHSLRNKADR